MEATLNSILRQLPSVQRCVSHLLSVPEYANIPESRLVHLSRRFLDTLRQTILARDKTEQKALTPEDIFADLSQHVCLALKPSLQRVINGTGIILHTNLGRSLLSMESANSLVQAASFPSNLELDLESGKRGLRYSHVESLICELTGAEAAMVVNNNAAAVLLALETLAKGKEVVVSRGQLVEIGGAFRIPDVMTRSGAHLVEVGTTNRTHLADYENALSANTGLLLRVHCSNYRIIGFSEEVPAHELVQIGHREDIPVMEDLGSGCLIDLRQFGLEHEPTVQECLAAGVDLVTFSGDKLLGGPQAGILAGKKDIIQKIQKNPLNRALRIDKLTLVALESTLRQYLTSEDAVKNIPTLRMIAETEASLRKRCNEFIEMSAEELSYLCVLKDQRLTSQVGGGSLPAQDLASWGICVIPHQMKSHQLERRLRKTAVAVIGRLEQGHFLLDMRTISTVDYWPLLRSLRQALQA